MYLEIVGRVVAGMGLFFVGLKTLTGSMQQMASPKFRQLITKVISRPFASSLLGAATGLIMQAPSGVIAILTGMQAGGMITLRQAMPIVAWCNVGAALLAFLAVIPISVFVCYLLGLTGFLLLFSTKKKYVVIITAVFGAGLLFFGLDEITSATKSVLQFPWVQKAMPYANRSTLGALVVGIIISGITQSFMAITIMSVSLVKAGALGAPQAMMIIYGANVGGGFIRRLMTASMAGQAKQLFLYQNYFRYIGTGGSVILFYLFQVNGIPLMLFLSQKITGDLGVQMALIAVTANLPAVILAEVFREKFARFLEKLSPPTAEDDLTKLRQLSLANREDPRDMLEKIQDELGDRTRNLIDYAEAARAGGKPKTPPEALHHSVEIVFNEISAFEAELMRHELPPEETQRLSTLMNISTLLRMLDQSLFQMTCLVRDRINKEGNSFKDPVGNLVEGLEVLLFALSDAMTSRESADFQTLGKMTSAHGKIMEEFRRKYSDQLNAADAGEKGVFLDLTNHYEHAVWIINRLSRLLEVNPAASN